MHNVVEKQMYYRRRREFPLPHNHGDQFDAFGQLIHNSKHAIERPAEWSVRNEIHRPYQKTLSWVVNQL